MSISVCLSVGACKHVKQTATFCMLSESFLKCLFLSAFQSGPASMLNKQLLFTYFWSHFSCIYLGMTFYLDVCCCCNLTLSLPWCHLKPTNKNVRSETHQPFFFCFTVACERIFIKLHSIEGRCAIRRENTLFAGTSIHLSAQKFYRLGQRWG